MPQVLVAGRIHAAGLDLLRSDPSLSLEVIDEVSTDSLASRIGGAEALLIRTQPLPAPVIAGANRLRMVSRHGVGYDGIDVAALDARGIPLSIVGDVNSRTVAEHALALMLALAKRLPAYDAATRSGGWAIRNGFSTGELFGKTLLVVGFGRIGRLVAGLAAAFGMHVVAHDPMLPSESIRGAGAEPAEHFADALRQADVVSLHVPKAGDKALVDAEALVLMKPTAFLINTSRGGLVDEAALALALSSGRLAGAGLDVFVDEPPSPENPLLRCERAILTPHAAGLTEDCAARMGRAAARNILDFFAGTLDPALVVNRPGA